MVGDGGDGEEGGEGEDEEDEEDEKDEEEMMYSYVRSQYSVYTALRNLTNPFTTLHSLCV